jgi:hypothetical protein
MKKLILLLLLLSIGQSVLFCQNTVTITGKITDKLMNEALPGASVTIKGSPVSVAADNDGRFSLQTKTVEKIILVISHIGYETVEFPVTVAGETTM